jgi:serine/threonine protein phosphatase PrpC
MDGDGWARLCLHCNATNRAQARFCSQCGKPLPVSDPPPAERASPRAAAETAPSPSPVLPASHRVLAKCPRCGHLMDTLEIEPACFECHLPAEPQAFLRIYPDGLTAEQKAIAWSRPQHAALASVYGVVQKGKTAQVLYQFVAGRPLRSLDLPVLPEQAYVWSEQLAHLVGYLHQTGISPFARNQSLDRLYSDASGLILLDLLESQALPAYGPRRLDMVNADYRFVARVLYLLRTGNGVTTLTESDLMFIGMLARKIAVVAAQARRSARSWAEELDRLFEAASGRPSPTARLPRPTRPPDEPTSFPSRAEALAAPSSPYGLQSDKGRVREHNEDAVYAGAIAGLKLSQPAYLCIVADGMGGHAAGEVASQTAIEAMAVNLPPLLASVSETDAMPAVAESALAQAVQQANDAVRRQGQLQDVEMGTTVVAALIIGNVAAIAHVGDSRAYWLHAGKLEAITSDHSLVARLVALGQIAPDEVYTHPQRSYIYRSLGMGQAVEVETRVLKLAPGDRLLLCSDGLWEMVRDPAIAEIMLAQADPQAACDALVAQANGNGGEDNISAIVFQARG